MSNVIGGQDTVSVVVFLVGHTKGAQTPQGKSNFLNVLCMM